MAWRGTGVPYGVIYGAIEVWDSEEKNQKKLDSIL